MEREAAVKPPLFFIALHQETRGSFQHNRKYQREGAFICQPLRQTSLESLF